ncbi:hypothetical protein IW138_006559, partial [Coemansia sp. RSA 986]
MGAWQAAGLGSQTVPVADALRRHKAHGDLDGIGVVAHLVRASGWNKNSVARALAADTKFMISGNTGGDGSSSGTGQEKAAAQPGAPGTFDMSEIFKEFLKAQAERDEKQAERDEKQAERDKLWREEQAERDEKQAERDKLWREEQAERDEKQAERDKKRDERDAKISKTLEYLRQAVAPGIPAELRTPASRSLKINDGSVAKTSKVASMSGTPQTYIEKVDKFDKEWYVKVSNEYDDICTETDLRDALDMLGDGWSSSWDQFSKIPATTIEDILTTYRSKCTAFQAGLAAPKVSESSYQSAFGALAEAVQEHVSAQPGLPALHWFDTHSANIRRADGTCRKPDGCFSVHPARHQWKDIAVVVEIKDHM